MIDPDAPAGSLRLRQALLPATGRLARVMRQAEEIAGITRPEGRGEPAGKLSSAIQMIGQRVPYSSGVQAVSPHPGQPFRFPRSLTRCVTQGGNPCPFSSEPGGTDILS